MPEMSGFTRAVKAATGGLGTDSGKAFAGGFGEIIAGSAIGTAIGGLAGKLGATFMDGLSTGINRLDTLNNFPRVMETFGYSADEASASVNKIMEHLRGLPTASQDVVALTQAISDSTGDLTLASDAALGFNDMMLAAGASQEDMATATGILNRVLGKGSATTAQWQSLMAVMPKQLDLVAESMLGAGASSMDLYAALEDGTYSYNDMLAAIAKLDKEGGSGMASFYEQAKANSVGVGSAIANIQNRIGAGWANVLDAIGQQEIHDTLEKLADALKAPLDMIANGITALKDAGVFEWLAEHMDIVSAALAGLGGAAAAFVGFFQVGPAIANATTAISGLWTVLMANPMMLIVAGIAAVVSGLVWFFTQTETGKAIWQGFCDLLSGLWTGLQEDWAAFCGVLSREWESFQAFLAGIPEWWQGIVDYWTSAFAEFGGYMNEAWEKIKGDFKAAWDFISNTLNAAWTALSAGIVQWGTNITTGITTAWDTVKNVTTTAWNAIKTTTSSLWNGIRNVIGSVWDAISSLVTSKVEVVANYLSNKWGIIRDTASNVWNGIKETIGGVVDMIKAIVTGDFDAIGSAAERIWNGVKNTIGSAIEGAKNLVGNAIDAIKGFFNFSFEWPHIPLPHINYSLIEVPLLGTIPDPTSLSISWYGKGGVFDAATLIGIGEKGREAALPLNAKTYGEIAKGISSEMGGAGVVVTGNTFVVREEADIDRIADALARKTRRERWAMA